MKKGCGPQPIIAHRRSRNNRLVRALNPRCSGSPVTLHTCTHLTSKREELHSGLPARCLSEHSKPPHTRNTSPSLTGPAWNIRCTGTCWKEVFEHNIHHNKRMKVMRGCIGGVLRQSDNSMEVDPLDLSISLYWFAQGIIVCPVHLLIGFQPHGQQQHYRGFSAGDTKCSFPFLDPKSMWCCFIETEKSVRVDFFKSKCSHLYNISVDVLFIHECSISVSVAWLPPIVDQWKGVKRTTAAQHCSQLDKN